MADRGEVKSFSSHVRTGIVVQNNPDRRPRLSKSLGDVRSEPRSSLILSALVLTSGRDPRCAGSPNS
jgi:hypothetical protein